MLLKRWEVDVRVCYYKKIGEGRSGSSVRRVISSEPEASSRFPVASLGNRDHRDYRPYLLSNTGGLLSHIAIHQCGYLFSLIQYSHPIPVRCFIKLMVNCAFLGVNILRGKYF